MNILRMSLQASAIIAFALLLRKLALDRLPKRGFVALWLLAAARMLLPWELPFRYSASALLSRAMEAPTAAAPLARAAIRGALYPTVATVPTAAPAAAEAVLPAISPWRIVWLTGLLACALALLVPHLRWRRVYARSLPLEDANAARWLDGHRLLRRVRLRISDEVPTPLSYGLLHPVILLPASMDRSDEARLRCVLLHEQIHIRRFDTLAKLVLAAALCAHWFNPLAWVMYLLANRDIELACDSAVLRELGEAGRRDYARALLDLAANQSGLPSPLSNGFSRQTIEERIRAIMKTKHLTKFAALAMALLVAFSALAFATSAEEETVVAGVPNDRIEALMFDGWEDASLREYDRVLWTREPDPSELLGLEGVWDNPRYTNWLRYVLDPLATGSWTLSEGEQPGPAAGVWEHTESGGTGNADGSEMTGYWFRVRCTVIDTDLLTAGEYAGALQAVVEGMEDALTVGANQETMDARAAELIERYSDGERIAFEIEGEVGSEVAPNFLPEGSAEENPLAGGSKEVAESEALLAELTFDGYEKMSVSGYREWLEATQGVDALLERTWSTGDGRYGDYLEYVFPFVTAPDPRMAMYCPVGSADVDGTVEVRILDPEVLTVGELRDGCKAVVEGIRNDVEAFGEALTQERLDEIGEAYLEEYGSDLLGFRLMNADMNTASRSGFTAAPEKDSWTERVLEEYAVLGLAYGYEDGQLRMAYQGREVRSIYDPVTQIVIANSSGPEGMEGKGRLTVVYEEGVAVGLVFED